MWAALALLLPPAAAWPSPAPTYSGAFYGIELSSGGLLGEGRSFRAHGRLSTPLHLADVALGYALDYAPDAHHRLWAEARLHPLLFFLLTGGDWGPALAAPYVGAGLAPTWGPGGGALAWQWSVGTDIPLSAPDVSPHVWLGLGYHQTRPINGGVEHSTLEVVDLTLGLRWNGWPGP